MIQFNEPIKPQSDMSILERIYFADVIGYKSDNAVSRGVKNYKSDLADMNVKACPCCMKTYERYLDGGRRYTDYFSNIPKLGKEKKVCPKCKAKNRGVLTVHTDWVESENGWGIL